MSARQERAYVGVQSARYRAMCAPEPRYKAHLDSLKRGFLDLFQIVKESVLRTTRHCATERRRGAATQTCGFLRALEK